MPSPGQALFEGADGRVLIADQRELRAFGLLWRDNGQPPVLPDWEIGLRHKAEDVGVEPQCLLLVRNEDTGHDDPQRLTSPLCSTPSTT
jgi:hypothetical protein